jgi:N-acetyl-gamma-glutamyl-phosphate reductase
MRTCRRADVRAVKHTHPALTPPHPHPQSFAAVFPHLITATDIGPLVKISDVDFDKVDAVFCCLPHATTQQIIKGLPGHLKIVDLSADFRLRDVNTYAEW